MKLQEVKNALKTINEISIKLENGTIVPKHFHITEVGLTTKNFIDCGGVVREEKKINFQLWEENDLEHRLSTTKLHKIIELSEKTLGLGNFEVEVEYQAETIGLYNLDFKDGIFILLNKQTDCLAKDSCETDYDKQKVHLSDLNKNSSSCCETTSQCC